MENLLNNEFYVYQVDDSLISDIDLLDLVKTSIQTLRVGDSLYFGVNELLDETGYKLIRAPIINTEEQHTNTEEE